MANYMGFKIITNYIFMVRHSLIYNAVNGSCIAYLVPFTKEHKLSVNEGFLNLAVASLYARNYIPVKRKEQLLAQIKYIRKTFESTVYDIRWIDQKSKLKVIDKLNAMGQLIAYPDEVLNLEAMNKYYNGRSDIFSL